MSEFPAVIEISKDKGTMRENILTLENEIAKHEQIEFITNHHFAGGVYARELNIPKGTLLTGKIHKHANLNIIIKGDISVVTEDGIKRFQAPAIIASGPGIKRVGFAHEDTVWLTLHATDKTDPDEIEEDVIAETFEDVEQLTNEELKKLQEV